MSVSKGEFNRRFLDFAGITTLITAIFYIAKACLTFFLNINTTDLVSEITAVSFYVVLYLLVSIFYFLSRNRTKIYALIASTILLVILFLIPFVMSLVGYFNRLVAGEFDVLSDILNVNVPLILGVTYLIFLILNFNHYKKEYLIVLKIFGVIIGIILISSDLSALIKEVLSYIESIGNLSVTLNTTVSFILTTIESSLSILIALIITLLPFYLDRKHVN